MSGIFVLLYMLQEFKQLARTFERFLQLKASEGSMKNQDNRDTPEFEKFDGYVLTSIKRERLFVGFESYLDLFLLERTLGSSIGGKSPKKRAVVPVKVHFLAPPSSPPFGQAMNIFFHLGPEPPAKAWGNRE
jgi:hypothetical protein